LGIQQLRVATPQALSGDTQLSKAISAQSESQTSSQQNGSTLQTVLQQAPSAQFGAEWDRKQLPASGSPQASQTLAARIAQLASHATWQQ
jgi:hypothetical protein